MTGIRGLYRIEGMSGDQEMKRTTSASAAELPTLQYAQYAQTEAEQLYWRVYNTFSSLPV